MSELLDRLAQIRAFIFDIDGVLTSGRVLVTEEGHMLRSVNIKDGFALQHAVKAGYPLAIISGGKSEGMRKRFEGLGLTDIFLGQSHKSAAFTQLLEQWNLPAEQVLYMGDDMPDLPVLRLAGVAACPADAANDIRSVCHYISPLNGGEGCAREILERVMKLQNRWWDDQVHHW